MKKFITCMVLLLLPLFHGAYAIGLGDISVRSSLNQPFDADIELLDIDNLSPSGIRASTASDEDFERMGIERENILDALTYSIEKNAEGKWIIKIRSTENISEPYIELLLELAWATGELSRNYTILLDPPDYKLVTIKKDVTKRVSSHSSYKNGVVEKTIVSHVEHNDEPASQSREAQTYGPIIGNETIWQIAQRYKTPDLSLQQIILAILGANESAFIEGNLNGLKQGARLTIPDTSTIKNIPASLALREVAEQDDAWQSKRAVNHVLLPPYVDAKTASAKNDETTATTAETSSTASEIPGVPGYTKTNADYQRTDFSQSPSLIPAQGNGATIPSNQTMRIQEQHIKAELDIARAAIESVRETNSLLNEQVRMLQGDNKRLQQQITQRDQQIKQMQEQLALITKRQGLAGQASPSPVEENSSIWPWLLLLLLIILGIVYWTFGREKIAERFSFLNKKTSEPSVAEGNETIEEQTTDIDTADEQATPIIDEVTTQPILIPETVTESIDESIEQNQSLNLIEEDTASNNEELIAEESPSLVLRDDVKLTQDQHNETVVDANEAIVPEQHVVDFIPDPIFKPAAHDTVEQPKESAIEPDKALDLTVDNPVVDDAPEEPNIIDEHILEFEPGLTPVANEPVKSVEEITHVDQIESIDDETNVHQIDFAPDTQELTDQQTPEPTKSKQALNTLLDLAKTYISMGDVESAKQSLDEVLEHGNESQQEEAKKLLDELS